MVYVVAEILPYSVKISRERKQLLFVYYKLNEMNNIRFIYLTLQPYFVNIDFASFDYKRLYSKLSYFLNSSVFSFAENNIRRTGVNRFMYKSFLVDLEINVKDGLEHIKEED